VRPAFPPPPPRRHRRLPWRRLELASLDFEATGLDFRRDTIVSFGVVPIRMGRIDVGDSVYELVDPAVAPSPVSVTVHGLRPIDLRGAPDLRAARVALGAAISGRFLITWAAQVEAGFLASIYGGGIRSWLRRCIDVRKLAFALEGDPPAPFTLTAVADRYGVPVASPHHALDDALVTAQLMLVVGSRLAALGATSVREVQRVGRVELLARHRP
jgi:DNA polymerase-3 subunit epsilon